MKAVITFGRMNPPTLGHQKLFDKILSVAQEENAKPFVFLSSSQDKKKNPLSFQEKVKIVKAGYKPIAKFISNDSNIRNIFQAIQSLIDKGYTDITLVVGDDRVDEFNKVVGRYINIDHKDSLNLDRFKVVSAGSRNPDSIGVTGISASQVRSFVMKNDFENFQKLLLQDLSVNQKKFIFQKLRKNLQEENTLQDDQNEIESFKEYLMGQQNTPHALEIGTDEIVDAYINMTPGQNRSY